VNALAFNPLHAVIAATLFFQLLEQSSRLLLLLVMIGPIGAIAGDGGDDFFSAQMPDLPTFQELMNCSMSWTFRPFRVNWSS
jgi:hypothetical protein